MLIEIAIVCLLTLLNGLLAMAELAIVSARPARLKVMAEAGQAGAAAVLGLQEQPGRFLSAVQIGITMVGILSGAISGAALGDRVAAALAAGGIAPGVAEPLGVGLVVAAITYLSLIVGELVPKQVALRDPEAVAVRLARPMATLARLTTPVVWLLDKSGRLVLRLLGQAGESEQRMTDEEIKMTIAEAESAGVLSADEREMIAGVMRVADRSARALMTPRRDVELIDLAEGEAAAHAKARETRRSRLPVRDGGPDDIVGVIAVRDILTHDAGDGPLAALVRTAPIVMEVTEATDVIERLRESVVHMVLVFDEYGHFEGIVTPMDVLEAITGSFTDGGEEEPALVERADGSFLIAGWMPADEFADRLGLRLPETGDFDTVAGFVLERMRRLPALGESFLHAGWRIEVVDLDGLRIDKVLVQRTG